MMNAIKRGLWIGALIALVPALAQAYPQIDHEVPTGGLPIKVYQDQSNPDLYWYIPQSIDPWTRDSRYQSSLYQTDRVFSFVFRGQASVDPEMLRKVAAAVGTSVDHFTPIAYEYSKNLVCQNFYAGDPSVQWLFPKMIGNYLEIVPISLRTTNPDLIDEIAYHLRHGGLECVVDVGFKASATAYKVTVTGDMDQVYHRFEAAAHAEGLFWEADIHTMIQHLWSDHVIHIQVYQDQDMNQTEIDKKQKASLDEIEKKMIDLLFKPVLTLPEGSLAGRGKPFSLRADYQSSEENRHFTLNLESDGVVTKDSQIGIRMALQ